MMVDEPKTHMVDNKSFRLIKAIEFIIKISTIIVSEIIEEKRIFDGDKKQKIFEELKMLYSTNESIIRDFAIFLIETYIFPSNEKRASLTKKEFEAVLE
mmetsp:Transcript_37355/g.27562  ORF Transcript_37355/g.27562 Transcript_37355/m.27562 type:complete len:99 (+) Transcript_37355:214-510(+)